MIHQDDLEKLNPDEIAMIKNGMKLWELDVLKEQPGGYLSSETIQRLINAIITNTWIQAKRFYEKESI